jgi:hypothetical protein
MPVSPEIGLQFQPNQALQRFPQQAIGLNQLGQEEGKRKALVSLNQMPGMVEAGIYTDQGLMALSQIDPAMRDEAVMQREKTLEARSLQKKRQAEADALLEQSRTSALTDVFASGLSTYYSAPGAPEARQQAMTAAISGELDAMEKDGRAAQLGITPAMIAAAKQHTNPDDILVKVLKHTKNDARGEYLLGRKRGEQISEPPAAGAPVAGPEAGPVQDAESAAVWRSPDEEQPPNIALEGWFNKPWEDKNLPIPMQTSVDSTDEGLRIRDWAEQERSKLIGQMGTMSSEEFEAEAKKIDDAEEAELKASVGVVGKKPNAAAPVAQQSQVVKVAQEDLLAKAEHADAMARKLRAMGDKTSIKAGDEWAKQADGYRKREAELKRLAQGDRRLDQADTRIQAMIDRAKATQAPLPEEAVQFVADQIIRGNAQAGAGLARNQTAKAQIISAYTKLAKERGMSPGDVNAAINEFQGLQQASRTLGARSANIDVAAEELAQFIGPAERASAAVPRTDFVPVNRLIQLGEAQWSPQQAAFVAANRSVINAFAALASRGVPTVHGTEEAEKMLSTAQTHAQYQAVLRMLWQEAQAAIAATKNVRKHVREAVTGEESKPAPYPGDAKPAPQKQGPKAGGGWTKQEIDAEMKRRGIK